MLILDDLEIVENMLSILLECNLEEDPESYVSSERGDSTDEDQDDTKYSHEDEEEHYKEILDDLIDTEMLLYSHKKMLIKYAPKTAMYPPIEE